MKTVYYVIKLTDAVSFEDAINVKAKEGFMVMFSNATFNPELHITVLYALMVKNESENSTTRSIRV